MYYPQPLRQLVERLRKFPGVGMKSAERFAFALLQWKKQEALALAKTIHEAVERLSACSTCGGWIEQAIPCPFCDPAKRNPTVLCVVATARDLYAIEGTRSYDGLYHVLGGVLSPLDGVGPDQLRIQALRERLAQGTTSEVILALDATLEGDATAHYLKEILQSMQISATRLAFGIPMGSAFEYVDGSTLSKALAGRGAF